MYCFGLNNFTQVGGNLRNIINTTCISMLGISADVVIVAVIIGALVIIGAK